MRELAKLNEQRMKAEAAVVGLARYGAAIRAYVGVIVALLRREEERRRAAPMESLAEVLEPIILIAISSVAWWLLDRRNSSPLGGSPVLFYGTGFFALYFFIYVSRRMKRAIDRPSQRFPMEQRLDHILVHIFLRMVDYLILGIVGFGFIYFMFTTQALPSDFIPVLEAFLAIAMIGFGWGIICLAANRLWRMSALIFPAFNRVLILFSGVFYIVDFSSPTARYVLSFNPMLHAITLFRKGFYPNHPTIVLDTGYLAACAILSVFFGLVIERATRRSEGR